MVRACIRVFFLIFSFLVFTIGYTLAFKSEEYPKQHSVLPLNDSISNDSLTESNVSYKDSCITIAAGTHYQHGALHNFFYGKHYRDLWALPIEVKVFDIGSVNSGLKVHKKGGGFQTLSLKLADKDKKKYVLRSIDKNPTKSLPPLLQKTFAENIFRDQTSAMHPYAALVIPKLSEAAGLFHTNPVLYFIPYDERFGQYAKEFEGRVVLFEEFPDSSWAGNELFNYADDIIGSELMLAKYYKQQNVKIDERMLARARIFDLWIGDWDRHTDQWKWAEYRHDGLLYYKPIARDRDMAFCKFNDSGIITFISSKINHKLQTFDYRYDNMQGLEKNGRYIDHLLLNSLTKQDILSIADSLKANLSDRAIEEAIGIWPEELYRKTGSEIISKLKVRRDHLTEAAEKFYKLIAKDAIITGTDMIETVQIIRIDDNQTSVKIFNENEILMYSRIFLTEETETIKIFTLKGNDQITLTGIVKDGIEVEIFGGEGNDLIADHSHVKGLSKKTKIYDSSKGNRI
ncbi:MAG TPA: hypothetical protein VNW99_03840, partial [Cytophagaceae bacterium]|nr:hypothetical protein [Cytophagaceae bacterium]